MISIERYNGYCGSLPAASHVVQWGGAHVWKVGGKVFAIAGWSDTTYPFVTFKCSDISYEVLRQQPGLRPAPYFASRGAKWIQFYGPPGLGDEELCGYVGRSYRLVAQKLTRPTRAELGLD